MTAGRDRLRQRTHHCVVIGACVPSQRGANDEADLLVLIAAVLDVADGAEVVWATDLNAGGAALLIALLADHGQQLLYIPGRIVTTQRRPTAVTARPMPRTHGSSPTRPGCAPIRSRFEVATRSAPICGC